MKIAKIDIFKRRVVFFDNREEMDKYLKYSNSEQINDACCKGICIAFDNEYYIGVFDNSLAVLAHEINHACFCICDDTGVELDNGNRETFCYMSEYLFKIFSKEILKKQSP